MCVRGRGGLGGVCSFMFSKVGLSAIWLRLKYWENVFTHLVDLILLLLLLFFFFFN